MEGAAEAWQCARAVAAGSGQRAVGSVGGSESGKRNRQSFSSRSAPGVLRGAVSLHTRLYSQAVLRNARTPSGHTDTSSDWTRGWDKAWPSTWRRAERGRAKGGGGEKNLESLMNLARNRNENQNQNQNQNQNLTTLLWLSLFFSSHSLWL